MTEKIFNKKSKKKTRQHLRNNMTEPEIILWSYLKNSQINGFKFRRQYSVEDYVIDFYCPELKLGVELDGSGHSYHGKIIKDEKRTEDIRKYGIEIIRFGNSDVLTNASGVASVIYEKTLELSKK